jgi:hypothetical protein
MDNKYIIFTKGVHLRVYVDLRTSVNVNFTIEQAIKVQRGVKV